jgi:hypothetical protein
MTLPTYGVPQFGPMDVMEPPMDEPPMEALPPEPEPEPEQALVVADGGDDPSRVAAAIGAAYGADCPLVGLALGENPTDDEWSEWPRALWDRHRDALVEHLHDIDRCRRFRIGDQWLSRIGAQGPWREPARSPNTIRFVHNVIGPALDWRLQVLMEQRPGFRCVPASRVGEPDVAAKSAAGQRALDHMYRVQTMPAVMQEAAGYAQTDGVSFLHTYWNPDGGSSANGQPLGEGETCVHRLEDVRVSANATATKAPAYWVVRETMPLAQAVLQYGAAVVESDVATGDEVLKSWRQRGANVQTTDLLQRQPTVERFTVYLEPSRYVPNGATVVVVGRVVTFLGPLLLGCVPIVRVTDGGKDPAFYPKPQMLQWLELQTALNAGVSKWLENIRKNSGGRFLARANAIVQETLTGAMDSVIEVRAPGDINNVVMPMQGFSVGKDVMDLISWTLGRLEDLSGFTPSARGQTSGNESGRAILAAKESLERHFAGAVMALADAMAKWGTVQLRMVRMYYEMPRLVGVMGNGRPDLVREIQAQDVDGVDDVSVDPETLMPTPRSLKLFQLDDLYAKQIIGPDEYRRRYPMASMDDISTPNALQESYALRVVEMLRTGAPLPPVLWQEDENIGQTVLERELILAPNVDPMIQQAAGQRWMELAAQAMQKMAPPPMAGAPMEGGPAPAEEPDLGAATPTGLMPGPIAAAPISVQPQTLQDQAAATFEQAAVQ